MVTTTLRPLTLGELLDRTFQLYRQHFITFVGIAALPQLLVLVFQLWNTAVEGTANFPVSAGRFAWFFVGTLLALIVNTMSQAATVVAVSHFHLGRPLGIAEAFAAIRGRIVRLCIITVVLGILVMLGFLALIVPGILLALRWSVAIPAAVLEDAGVSEARTRSADLTEGARGRALVIYMLYFVLVMIVSSIWQVPIFIAAFAAGVSGTPSAMPEWTRLLAVVGTFFTQALVAPLLTVAIALYYYDQRVRKEAFDLDAMIAALDEPLGPAPAGA